MSQLKANPKGNPISANILKKEISPTRIGKISSLLLYTKETNINRRQYLKKLKLLCDADLKFQSEIDDRLKKSEVTTKVVFEEILVSARLMREDFLIRLTAEARQKFEQDLGANQRGRHNLKL